MLCQLTLFGQWEVSSQELLEPSAHSTYCWLEAKGPPTPVRSYACSTAVSRVSFGKQILNLEDDCGALAAVG